MHLAPRLASLVDQPDHEILPAGVAEILMERWSLTWDSSPKSDDATDDEKYRLVTQTVWGSNTRLRTACTVPKLSHGG
jgi:hypothetical protein